MKTIETMANEITKYVISQNERLRKETAKEIINGFALSPRTKAMIAEKYGLSKEDLGEV